MKRNTKRPFSGTKFYFHLWVIITPRHLRNNKLPTSIALRYPQRLHGFQGIVTAVQEPDSFPKTPPYHQMTGTLTVKETLHKEQENHEAMLHLFIVLKLKQQSDFRWKTGYCANTEGSMKLYPQKGKIKIMKSNRVRFKTVKFQSPPQKKIKNRKIILLSFMHGNNGTCKNP